MRNDGRDNLLGALILAGQYVIPEVSHQVSLYNEEERERREGERERER